MELHEIKIKHKYLVQVDCGNKTFELRKNDRDYQVGDLIHFIDIKDEDKEFNTWGVEPAIDKDALYKITYVLKDVPEYGLDKDYCILGIKKLKIEEE